MKIWQWRRVIKGPSMAVIVDSGADASLVPRLRERSLVRSQSG